MRDAEFGVLVSVGIALFLSLITHATVCAEQHECLRRGTCYSLNSGWFLDPSCSFRTTVSPTGYKLLNTSVQYETMMLMNRGVCAPGMRQQVDAMTGAITCVRKRSYPSAFIEEIGKPSATTDHDRYCGKWIDAGSIAYGSQKWAFFDADATEADVDDVIRAKGASRMATTDLGKFRSSCRTMVASNSAGASAKQAYDLLVPSLRVDSLGLALESVGFLASHYCDTPALVGIDLNDDEFTVKVLSGLAIGDQDLKNAMYVVGEDRTARSEARDFGVAMRELAYENVAATTQNQAAAVVRGSYTGTWMDGYVGTTLSVTYTTYNDPLGRFVAAYNSHGQVKAHAYLRGVAAVCSLAARSMVSLEEGNMIPFFLKWTQTGEAGSRTTAALGRLVAPEEDHDDVDAHTVTNASVIRLSSLSAVVSASRSSAREVCLAAAKRVFPDEFDRIAFNTLVTPTLYERLHDLSDQVREAAAATVADDLIGKIFASNADRTNAADKVFATKVRIAGAPRGSWAGIDREFRRPDITSDDSALTIIIKQARAVFLDRLLPVATGADICEHPALYPGVSRNAYLLLTSTKACSMLLPGLIVPPFADERYDDESLATRVGFVMAHEFMHVTAYTSQWDRTYSDTLMVHYPSSTHVEAIADLGGVASLMRINFISNTTICASVSQLFCGRVGWAPVWDEPAPWHPPTNMRGDNVCAFLRLHFAS